ncbi:hypothetical protein [Actinoallomurus iriomotensis]|uniref:Uncharacterized protein n=1 Tax=Actinoallomurus iriomotensis TaxID=478107 RepID=A0A9W6RUE4_9ACTN|nr:hypothetical protein [Actinoallomurus iriomotensis]GLY81868.1 hypothetical protein Airi01_101350 [Actinoallomurus iriomotensis]
MADIDPRVILDTPMGPNDAGAATIRDYLTRLLAELWKDGEGFSGKRPFGNSSWEGELLSALARAGHITGTLDEDGYLDDADEETGYALIAAAIRALGAPTEDTAAAAEVARLRAGEADDPSPADTMPTPAQWIRRWNDATAERRLEVITRIFGELDRARRCFEMDHENRLAEAERVARRLAVAPTRWAYDQACKALWRHRQRADVAEAANARVRAIVQALVDDVRANTDEPGELINAQLLLDAVATALLPADGLTTPPQPATPDLTDGEVKFLADLIGGTGDFVWGGLAVQHGMDLRDVEQLYRKLAGHTDPSAEAAPREGCVDHMPTPNPDCEACTR